MKSGTRLLDILFLGMFVSTVTAAEPMNVNASDGTFADRVQVVWDPEPGTVTYPVYRCTTRGATCGRAIGFPQTTRFDDTTAVPGTSYFYRVKACNPSDGCSILSRADPGFRGRDTEAEIDLLREQVADLMTLLEGATRINTDGNDTLRFSGMNVQIVNGDNVTKTMNGTGNLIVGYNESRSDPVLGTCFDPADPDPECDHRDGSHNVIIGDKHNFTSWGGLVVGLKNDIRDEYASVSGGSGNLASGPLSSISGGFENHASHIASSISGGSRNLASGVIASISGGTSNVADGTESSVSGGRNNQAEGRESSISGGRNHLASGEGSSITGGAENRARGEVASISGGFKNVADGTESSISGGRNNVANGARSSISGGWQGITRGDSASVSGGEGNAATGDRASVSGGRFNNASGFGASVSGGNGNHPRGQASSISGGVNNHADGARSSISGGVGNVATGLRASISGGSDKTAAGENCIVGDNGDDC